MQQHNSYRNSLPLGMGRLKILMVLWSGFPPDPRVEREARTLLRAGHDVHLLCLRNGTQTYDEIVDGIKVRRVDNYMGGVVNILRRPGVRIGLMRPVEWEREIQRSLVQVNPDVIHCHDLRPFETIDRFGIRTFCDLHELYPVAVRHYAKYGGIISVVGRWDHKEFEAFKYAREICTISDQARHFYTQKYGRMPMVIRNTVDLEEFDFLAAQYREPNSYSARVMYVGGYSAGRGLDLLIKAMNIVTKEVKAHLCLVGPVPEQLSEMSNQPIMFTGKVMAQRLPALMETATVLVHPLVINSPQTNYSCPNKIFEYMAARKPVVAFEAESFKEYIGRTRAGILVEPHSIEKLAQAIIKLIQYKSEAMVMGLNGREAVEQRYNWSIDGEELCRIYRESF